MGKVARVRMAALAVLAVVWGGAAAGGAQLREFNTPGAPAAAQLTLSSPVKGPRAEQTVRFDSGWTLAVPSSPYTFTWGDGTEATQSSQATASHTFASGGTYEVLVVASYAGANGAKVMGRKELTVTVGPATAGGGKAPPAQQPTGPSFGDQIAGAVAQALSAPQLKLSPMKVSAVTNQTVELQTGWTQAVSQPLFTFAWGDGGQSAVGSQTTAEHVYAKSGKYRVIVTGSYVGANGGEVTAARSAEVNVAAAPQATATGEVPVKVAAAPAAPAPAAVAGPVAAPAVDGGVGAVYARPTIGLRADKAKIAAGDTVHFTVVVNPPGEFSAYVYDFGDGSVEGGENARDHVYEEAGRFSATVSTGPAADPREYASGAVGITVQAGPPALTLTPETGEPKAGKAVILDARLEPQQSGVAYVFDWGDGTRTKVGTLGRGSHVYANAAMYTVRVTAGWKGGRTTQTTAVDVQAGSAWGVVLAIVLGVVAVAGTLLLGSHMLLPLGTLHAAFAFRQSGVPELKGLDERGYVSMTFRPGAGAAEHRFTLRGESAAKGRGRSI